MIRYFIIETQKDGTVWRSVVHESATLREVKQTINAGILSGTARRAEDTDGQVLHSIDAKGKVV